MYPKCGQLFIELIKLQFVTIHLPVQAIWGSKYKHFHIYLRSCFPSTVVIDERIRGVLYEAPTLSISHLTPSRSSSMFDTLWDLFDRVQPAQKRFRLPLNQPMNSLQLHTSVRWIWHILNLSGRDSSTSASRNWSFCAWAAKSADAASLCIV